MFPSLILIYSPIPDLTPPKVLPESSRPSSPNPSEVSISTVSSVYETEDEPAAKRSSSAKKADPHSQDMRLAGRYHTHGHDKTSYDLWPVWLDRPRAAFPVFPIPSLKLRRLDIPGPRHATASELQAQASEWLKGPRSERAQTEHDKQL